MGNGKRDVIIAAIQEARAITRKGHDVTVYIASLSEIYPQELKDILLQLQDDEGILTLKSFPKHLVYDSFDQEALESQMWAALQPQRVNFTVNIHGDFDKWVSKHVGIGQVSGEEPRKAQPQQAVSDTRVVYEITYVGQEILLNNEFVLAKPNFNSKNDLIFDYLFKHPNETLTVGQIVDNATKESLGKSLHKTVENLGFRRELKKAFFDVSKNSIRFKNPVTRKDLAELGITRIRLP